MTNRFSVLINIERHRALPAQLHSGQPANLLFADLPTCSSILVFERQSAVTSCSINAAASKLDDSIVKKV